MRDVLLIELKRGGFEMDRKEMDQESGYVDDILCCGLLGGQPKISAFVVGHKMKKGIQPVRAAVADARFTVPKKRELVPLLPEFTDRRSCGRAPPHRKRAISLTEPRTPETLCEPTESTEKRRDGAVRTEPVLDLRTQTEGI